MDSSTSRRNGERGTLPTNLNGVKVGDFIELYKTDADIISQALDLTLTQKLIDNENVSMVGFPIKNLQEYSQELKNKGFNLQTDFTDKINFRNSTINENDSAVFYGGVKAKYKNNIQAIKLLKHIESEKRLATADEQYTLARYTGFGGISQAFDRNANGWNDEYSELKSLLSTAEYEKARESTLTAYYTEPKIIEAMYTGIINMGVDVNCKILEPSMGVGNFFSMLPDELSQCKLYGVELDDLTGRIAKQLYQKADIQIRGYQDAKYQDNFFDCSIGNVPFGDFKLFDERYVKENFLIHDYFFAKTIDKVKPNGIISFISSKGTMDKANPSFRKYIAQRAELIGAVRLPDIAFKAIAGTEVTTDIIFLRKREKPVVCEPEWVHIGLTEDNVPVNQYYLDNPQNLLGKMVFESSQFGQSAVLKPFNNFDLYAELTKRINDFTKGTEVKKIGFVSKSESENEQESFTADPNVKNYTYTVIDDNIYYRENETMQLCKFNGVKAERIKGMHQIRLALREVIDLQLVPNYSPQELGVRQSKLNSEYDTFVKKYGYITDKVNKNVFQDDSDSPLLFSIEDIDKDKNIIKSKIFTQATINPIEKFEPKTYEDLITLSMSTKGYLDIEYMANSFDCSVQDVTNNLKGKIYLNPQDNKWETADEYLTGNVKLKLDYARLKAQQEPELYNNHVKALETVQPKPLEIDEIDFRLGSSWIDIKFVKEFIYEISELPSRYRQVNDLQSDFRVCLTYNSYTCEYTIYNKKLYDSVKSTSVYGTKRKSFFEIVEDTLNLRECKVYDTIYEDGKEKREFNFKETQAARQKQELVKNEFKNYICSDVSRVNEIVKAYNDRFNVYRPRTFDGSHLTYDGMSNLIELREHQNNAVARILYGSRNVLLGHVVGAGKTYTMVAAAMELKRIGIANKPLFVVPNHLTEQWGGDFLKLYPTANILVATKKDFQPENRKRFISKICTGDYDAVIIGHTQFEKIPMSDEYVRQEMKSQIDEITNAVISMKDEDGQKYTVKQLENQKKKLESKLEKLNSKTKDNVITFEQTGVDHIFVDEAHYYKNCFVHTKMSNISGVATSNAQKSFDMLMKSKYITNKNDGKGVIFATGTPISNSMTEMFVMQRYLQPDVLYNSGISYFDEWASTFGQTVTGLEIKPEGKGYRMKTRFAKFFNLPELINMFSQVADIKVAADLNLPVPKMATGKPIIEVSKPNDYIKNYINMLADDAEKVRSGTVDPSILNMLMITHWGRMVALDPRLVDGNAPVDNDSKVFKCCNNIYNLYQKTNMNKGCQLVFCDLSTPKGNKIPMIEVDGVYVIDMDKFTNVYDEIKKNLMAKGIPEKDIAYIHDAKTDDQKAKLFEKCRNGEIRVLLGSTNKMGAGTNIQKRLIAVHHLDCPWRPADIEQRDGRILRQGNMFNEVYVFRYVTENTFDSYMWQTQENKLKFITQVITNKSASRSCEDMDDAILDCAEVKMLATGNPRIKEKMQLDNDVYVLQLEKSAYAKERTRLQQLLTQYPTRIENAKQRITQLQIDISTYESHKSDDFSMKIEGITYTERTKAAEALKTMLSLENMPEEYSLGSYCGLELQASRDGFHRCIKVKGVYENKVTVGESELGNITRIENACSNLVSLKQQAEEDFEYLKKQQINAAAELEKPFVKEDVLKEKLQRQVELNLEMELNQHTDIIMEGDDTKEKPNNQQKEESDIENEY
ncbi:DEAD/DEAH box helicase family protein [Paludicola sp. MB14-C6]|uniref:DEAD/DEAH box helicase family protein n=1 Tax=Paludihabitans sp. MB14-C6 TaxID=3070656 RepID=UPI0035A3A7B2